MDNDIAREMGRMAAALERVELDRQETNRQLEKVWNGVDVLSHRMMALEQSSSSTGKMVADMMRERHGVRLDRLEEVLFPTSGGALPVKDRLDKIEGIVVSVDLKSSTSRLGRVEATIDEWKWWLGSGRSFVVRLLLVVIGSSAVWAGASALIERIKANL